jgi:CRISPR-associated endonuclease/helicase Cas3
MSRYRWPMHFALLNNDCTWVIDEVQLMGVGASTAAQLQALREKLHTAGRAHTVWMTATLAEGRLRTVDFRRDLRQQPFDAADDEPLLRRVNATKNLRKAKSTADKKDVAGLASEILSSHVTGSRTLVVVNRVPRAQALYRQLAAKSSASQTPIELIHSRFRPADRQRTQSVALAPDFKGIIVATQAIEAGVDISARTLFTELAPWSSLVQRFGRLNRAGEWRSEAVAFWIDLDTDDEAECLPYEPVELSIARQRLEALTDVGPRSLAGVAKDPEEPALPVIRSKDVIELFDTEPDLAGQDIDISRFIRATDERDVQVAWRELGDSAPRVDESDLHRDELCRVGIRDFEKVLEKSKKKAWRYDGLRKSWVDVQRLVPGMTVAVDLSVGGYSPVLGFTKEPADTPAAIQRHAIAPDDDDKDILSGSDHYVTLRLHAEDTAEEMGVLLSTLGGVVDEFAQRSSLVDAARYHDAGKAHSVFQEMLMSKLSADDPRRTGGPWAKSDGQHGGGSQRPYFRHELASALAWLAEGRSDLGAYIVAAHHGKVRLSLRARPGETGPSDRRFALGVHDGDPLPTTDLGGGMVLAAQFLSLACMELGGGGAGRSWADRMLGVLEEFGPFRLSYLEMLVRVATGGPALVTRPS